MLKKRSEVPRRNSRSADFIPAVKPFQLDDIIHHYEQGFDVISHQLDRIESLLNSEQKDHEQTESTEFILRSAFMYSSSIMDFCFHELGKIGYLNMILGSWKETEHFKKMSLPLGEIRTALDPVNDPLEWFSRSLIRKMHSDVYQSGEQIKILAASIGISLPEEVCRQDKAMKEDWSITKKNLQEIYQIRNQITHQADRTHADAEFYEVSYQDFRERIHYCSRFVHAVHSSVVNKFLDSSASYS